MRGCGLPVETFPWKRPGKPFLPSPWSDFQSHKLLPLNLIEEVWCRQQASLPGGMVLILPVWPLPRNLVSYRRDPQGGGRWIYSGALSFHWSTLLLGLPQLRASPAVCSRYGSVQPVETKTWRKMREALCPLHCNPLPPPHSFQCQSSVFKPTKHKYWIGGSFTEPIGRNKPPALQRAWWILNILWAPTEECPFYHLWKSPKCEGPWSFSVWWSHLVMGKRTLVGWIQQKWVCTRKVKERRIAGRKTNNLHPSTKWSEPRRAPPAKAPQEPVSKARLALC